MQSSDVFVLTQSVLNKILDHHLIAVGVTNSVDNVLLRTLASDDNYFHVNDFMALDSIIDRILKEACVGVATPLPDIPRE